MRQLPQQPVTGLRAEAVVVHLEILDVGADDAVFPLGVSPQALGDLLEEILPAVQPGEPVELELVGHGRVFPQLDDAGHPVQNDPGPVGLGHKVVGAVGQGLHLVGLAVPLGHDDHRN